MSALLRGCWVLLAIGAAGCERTETKKGRAATIEVSMRAARSPDALGASDPIGSFSIVLSSDEPKQEATADVPFNKGAAVSLEKPFEQFKPTAAAQLTVWGIALSGARTSVGRAPPFELPAEGKVTVPIFLGVANAFSATPHALLERVGGAAVSLTDGRVLLVGGKSSGTMVAPAIYDHLTGAVTQVQGTTPQLTAPAVTALDGNRALVAGGFDATGEPTDEVWLFSAGAFAKQSFVLPKKVGEARAAWFPTRKRAVVVGGFLPAGVTDGGAAGRAATNTIAVIAFDGAPRLDTAGVLLQPRANASATSLLGVSAELVLVAGGVAAENAPALATAEVLSFDASGKLVSAPTVKGSNASSTAGLSPGRAGHVAIALPSGVVFLYGGADGAVPLADPSAMIFSPLLSDPGGFLPVAKPANPARAGARVNAQAALLPDGSLLLVGGLGLKPGDDVVGIFAPLAGQDPTSKSSFQGTYAPVAASTARVGGAAVVLPDRSLLIAGGTTTDGGVLPGEVFVPCADAAKACPQ